MQWPTQSPQINPIEHIWDQMGLFIRDMDNPPTTMSRLWGTLLQAWGAVTPRKDGGPCTEHASTTEDCDGHQGRSYSILSRKNEGPSQLYCSPKTSIYLSLRFVKYVWIVSETPPCDIPSKSAIFHLHRFCTSSTLKCSLNLFQQSHSLFIFVVS